MPPFNRQRQESHGQPESERLGVNISVRSLRAPIYTISLVAFILGVHPARTGLPVHHVDVQCQSNDSINISLFECQALSCATAHFFWTT